MSDDKINQEHEFEVANEENFEEEMVPDDFKGVDFLKNPDVGKVLEFTVIKIVDSKNVNMETKEGVKFTMGLKYKSGKIKRFDIHTDVGVYTINNWEIFIKLLGRPNGLLLKYANEHGGKFSGAKVTIKRLVNARYNTYDINDLAQLKNITKEEAENLQESIKAAIKENRLYEVSVN